MVKIKKSFFIFVFLGLGLMTLSCGSSHRIQSTEIPSKPMANEPVVTQKANGGLSGIYIVQKRDCLWEIAATKRVFGDSFEWPILFKANRDQIKDPDLIYPRQDLRVDKSLSIEEMKNAKQLASATPKFVPHSKPRETLPVNYF